VHVVHVVHERCGSTSYKSGPLPNAPAPVLMPLMPPLLPPLHVIVIPSAQTLARQQCAGLRIDPPLRCHPRCACCVCGHQCVRQLQRYVLSEVGVRA
jgi:hypothetical protein